MTEKANTPAGTSPAAATVKPASSVPDQGAAGNVAKTASAPAPAGGNTATSTAGAAPIVSTDGAKAAVAHAPNEPDASQGSAAKGGAGGSVSHPVTGGQSNEYRIRGHELLQIASQHFGIDTRLGVTEFQWDAANNDLVVRHSPPFSGVQPGSGPGAAAPEVK